MTVKEEMIKRMVRHGMFQSQAEEVIERVIAEPPATLGSAKRIFNEDLGEHPVAFVNIIWTIIKVEALQYIEEKLPEAWFKPMFMDKVTQEAWMKEHGYTYSTK